MDASRHLTSDVRRQIYRRAHLAKIHCERTEKEILSGALRMPFHSPRGQEVLTATVSVLLTPQDYMVTIYRGAHDLICKGVPLKLLWAEYAGRATGVCKGKGGPMHLTYPECGAMVTTGIVGAGLPIANGLALSSQVKGDGRVTVCHFGDGASNIGAFHEALNLASLWKLPVVFVCQNNRYAEHSSYALGTAVERISDRAASYSMRGVTVDGNDPAQMYGVTADAIARARAGEGPTLIEAMTFRLSGHSTGDDSHYMPKGELQEAAKNDPVPALRAALLDESHATEAEIERIEMENGQLLDEAVAFALASPYPEVIENRRDVFSQEIAA